MAKGGVADLVNEVVGLITHYFPGTPRWVIGAIVALAVLALVVTIAKPLVAPVRGAWRLLIQPRLRSKKTKQHIKLQSAFAQHLAREISRLNKAEDWRDEHFVELEAEVEVESRPPRFLFGIGRSTTRREKSITAALKRSKEPQILLEGDPGSGKSVALRHFALKLARDAAERPHLQSLLPVFVNLKEVRRETNEAISPALIRKHVLKSLNRTKDPAVAAFIDQQFEERLQAGTWIFLFDSFDEIPDILSSTENDEVIALYSAAIDDFFSGMNKCRGVIASRRYRGPRRYVWCLFRLVELTVAQQKHLVVRLLGDQPEREGELFVGLSAASDDVRAMTRNPLLLSLLCEHVKAGHVFPETAYEVFARFVGHRLARDETQAQARFGRDAKQISEIAEIAAFTMTADTAIGLSPTRAELAVALRRQGFDLPPDELGRSLNALEYMRLAKDDTAVQTSISDRQFSFAHRRFQEYFATRIVIAKPAIVPPEALLLDARWRETAVVLCQLGGGSEANEGVRQEALRMIVCWQAEASNSSATDPATRGGAYAWPRKAYHVLAILQAGFAALDEGAVEDLRESADSFLADAYSRGDLLDKKLVMELAAIVPRRRLQEFLQTGLANGSEWLNDVIFRQVARLPAASDTVEDWIRKAITRQAFSNEFGGRRSSMRAFAARLPNGERMRWIATYAALIKPIDLSILVTLTAILLGLHGWEYSGSYIALGVLAITVAVAMFSSRSLPTLYVWRLGVSVYWFGPYGESTVEAAVAVYALLWAPLAVLCARLDLVKAWPLLLVVPAIGVLRITRAVALLLLDLTRASPKFLFAMVLRMLLLVRQFWFRTVFGLIGLAILITASTTPVISAVGFDLGWWENELEPFIPAITIIAFGAFVCRWIYQSFRSLIERLRVWRWLDQACAGLDGEAISARLQSLKDGSLQILILREVRKRNLLRPSELGELALRRYAQSTKSREQRDIAFRLAETINVARQ